MNDNITTEVTVAPVFQSKWGYHPYNFSTLKKLRKINKMYHLREGVLSSIAHKEKKLPHNRFAYSKTAEGVVKTPWTRPETPEIPYVGDLIEEGRHGKGNPAAVRPIRYTVADIDAILEETISKWGDR